MHPEIESDIDTRDDNRTKNSIIPGLGRSFVWVGTREADDNRFSFINGGSSKELSKELSPCYWGHLVGKDMSVNCSLSMQGDLSHYLVSLQFECQYTKDTSC